MGLTTVALAFGPRHIPQYSTTTTVGLENNQILCRCDKYMLEPYLTPETLCFRENLARLISPLRRVRSRTPFFRLAAHRIPTLWGLYRGLLREAPTDNIRWRVRMAFREHQHHTSTKPTIKYLKQGYKFLDVFIKARNGDTRLQAVLARYSRLIAAKRESAYWMDLLDKDLAWRQRLRKRAILTGGFMRPTLYNGPLPRMKPQPEHVTGMIVNRRRARTNRQSKQAWLKETLQDLTIEREFEMGLNKLVGGGMETIYSESQQWAGWASPMRDMLLAIQKSFVLETARASQPYPPSLLDAILDARRAKIANKTLEKARQLRGEVTRSTILRQRKGPPAHVLEQMSPEQREMDKVARGVGEVGYVGMVKKRLGFKLKDEEKGEILEGGEYGNRGLLDEVGDMLEEEMSRRRREEEEIISGGSRS